MLIWHDGLAKGPNPETYGSKMDTDEAGHMCAMMNHKKVSSGFTRYAHAWWNWWRTTELLIQQSLSRKLISNQDVYPGAPEGTQDGSILTGTTGHANSSSRFTQLIQAH
jgi:hypothetical protein